MKTLFKSFFFLGLLSLFLGCNSCPVADDEKGILNLLSQQEKDWNAGNIDAYMKGYWQSDSLIFVGKSGVKHGWNETLLNYKKSYPDAQTMGVLSFEILKIELLSNQNAFVLGKWKLQRVTDMPHGCFTLLLKKIQGQWFIVLDHSS